MEREISGWKKLREGEGEEVEEAISTLEVSIMDTATEEEREDKLT